MSGDHDAYDGPERRQALAVRAEVLSDAVPNGDKFVGFKAGAVTTSTTWTLPLADATVANQALTSSGAGILSWTTVALGSGTLNFIPKWTPNGSTLGNSQVQDNGVTLGIGAAPGAQVGKVDVVGTGAISPYGDVRIGNSVAGSLGGTLGISIAFF